MKKKDYLAYCCLTGFATLLLFLTYFLFCPRVSSPGTIYYVSPGLSKKSFIKQLNLLGIIKSPSLFYLYAYLHPGEHLKTGEYFFQKGTSFFELWKQVTKGKGLYYRSFTIVPGWSYFQLHQELLRNPYLHHDISKLPDQVVMPTITNTKFHPEGMFFPETYHFTRNNDESIILKKAFILMNQKLSEAWTTRANQLPYQNKYEALIVASIIEKESNVLEELPLIAGVIINRLKHNMLLQVDPTVIYGMGKSYIGKLHHENLIVDTPYNTYLHKGLPPTPIAMPSAASINAALHPGQHHYYYFVAKGNGSHVFSKTLEEHNIAVSKMLEPMKEKSTTHFPKEGQN